MWTVGISVYVISGPWHRFYEIHKMWLEQGCYSLHVFTSTNDAVIFSVVVVVFLSPCFLVFMLEIRLQISLRAHFLYLFIIFRNACGRHSNDELFITVSHSIVAVVDRAAERASEIWDNDDDCDTIASLYNCFSIQIGTHATLTFEAQNFIMLCDSNCVSCFLNLRCFFFSSNVFLSIKKSAAFVLKADIYMVERAKSNRLSSILYKVSFIQTNTASNCNQKWWIQTKLGAYKSYSRLSSIKAFFLIKNITSIRRKNSDIFPPIGVSSFKWLSLISFLLNSNEFSRAFARKYTTANVHILKGKLGESTHTHSLSLPLCSYTWEPTNLINAIFAAPIHITVSIKFRTTKVAFDKILWRSTKIENESISNYVIFHASIHLLLLVVRDAWHWSKAFQDAKIYTKIFTRCIHTRIHTKSMRIAIS